MSKSKSNLVFNTSALSSYILSVKKTEKDFMGIIRCAIDWDAKYGKDADCKEFAIACVIRMLDENGLRTQSNRVRIIAEKEFGFYKTKSGETGYRQFPTMKQLDAVFSKFQSLEDWNAKNVESNKKQAAKTAAENRKTNTMKDVLFSHLEKMRKELNKKETEKLDALIAHLEKMPQLFK